MSKQYGLIVAGQKSATSQPKTHVVKPSIFGSDSDSDGDGPPQLKKQGAPLGPDATQKRLAKRIQQKALEEDPTVFQYDELYDEMESKRDEEKKAKKNEVKKSKYINRLLEFADKRKLENERRIERMVQKEREDEGEQFKDKEAFVTSAYRKKLEELRKVEEQEKRDEYLESVGDVTKQRDLDGFYRHLYEQKLGPKNASENVESSSLAYAPVRSNNAETEASRKITNQPKSRSYRKRQSSEPEVDDDPIDDVSTAKKAHIQSNLDADSDFSIDSSDSEEEAEGNPKPKPMVLSSDVVVKEKPINSSNDPIAILKPTPNGDNDKKEEKIVPNMKEEDMPPPKMKEKSPIPKNLIDIWKKRTVGEVLDAALKKYYEKKANRNG